MANHVQWVTNYKCPTGTLGGCGSTNTRLATDGYVDCLACGLWFEPRQAGE